MFTFLSCVIEDLLNPTFAGYADSGGWWPSSADGAESNVSWGSRVIVRSGPVGPVVLVGVVPNKAAVWKTSCWVAFWF